MTRVFPPATVPPSGSETRCPQIVSWMARFLYPPFAKVFIGKEPRISAALFRRSLPEILFQLFVYVCLYLTHDMIFQVAHHDGLCLACNRPVPAVVALAVAVYDAIFLYSRSRFTRPIGRFVPVPATLKSSSFVMSSSSFRLIWPVSSPTVHCPSYRSRRSRRRPDTDAGNICASRHSAVSRDPPGCCTASLSTASIQSRAPPLPA